MNITELKFENNKKLEKLRENLEETKSKISELNSKIDLLKEKLKNISKIIKFKNMRERRNSNSQNSGNNNSAENFYLGNRTSLAVLIFSSLFWLKINISL